MWRWMEEDTWSGAFFGIEKFIKGRRPGTTTTFCPCCPEIDFNVPYEDVWQAEEKDQSVYARLPLTLIAKFEFSTRHKYTCFHSTDGCFNCGQFVLPKRDPDDVALRQGSSYVPHDVPYKAFLEASKKDEKEVCTSIRAFEHWSN